MPAARESLPRLREFVLSRARDRSPAVITRIDLVLEELLVNIFDYAYGAAAPGMVEVACQGTAGEDFVLEIRDWGRPFDPLARPAPDVGLDLAQREVGGLGIHLVREMSRSRQYRREGDCNVLEVAFRDP
jgi:serine/threonine-protein kinase RsbW